MTNRAASHRPSRARLLALGLSGIGVLVLLLIFGINSPNGIPLRSYYNVNVAFRDADNISVHSQIRMGGRLVGQVLQPRIENGQAVVRLQLAKDVQPLRSDTRILVRPRSAIGVRYVEILPGTSGTPIPDGGRIPAGQTASTRPLDEALSTLDPRTRARAQVLLRELGNSVAGRGEDLNLALGAAPGALRHVRSAMGAVAARRGAVAGLVRGADTLATALDPVRGDLAGGFAPEARTARAFADEPAALRDTLREAPPALHGISSGLGATRPLVRAAGRFARAALPALVAAPAAMRETRVLLGHAGPVLKAADPTLLAARSAVPTTLGLLHDLRPELAPLEAGIASSAPILDNLGPRYCDMRNMLGGWSSMMEYGNKAGNYLRFNVEGAAESVQGWEAPEKLGVLAAVGNPYPAPCEAGTESLEGK